MSFLCRFCHCKLLEHAHCAVSMAFAGLNPDQTHDRCTASVTVTAGQPLQSKSLHYRLPNCCHSQNSDTHVPIPLPSPSPVLTTVCAARTKAVRAWRAARQSTAPRCATGPSSSFPLPTSCPRRGKGTAVGKAVHSTVRLRASRTGLERPSDTLRPHMKSWLVLVSAAVCASPQAMAATLQSASACDGRGENGEVREEP